MLNGSCLCGAIVFSTSVPDRATACHCSQCRKQSGHHWASGHRPLADYTIQGDVRWYASSETAKRGFCPTCGTFLFWKHKDENEMSFSMGAIDGPTGVKLTRHIFTDDKGDYYDIPAESQK